MNCKNSLFYLLALCCALQMASAQSYNTNTWIDYNATYYKIKVGATGIYRIPQSLLAANGLGSINGSDIKIISKGREIPLYTSNNGALSSGDFVEFYAQKNDGEFDTQLYQYPSWQPTLSESLFSDTLSYFLTISPATSNLRYTATNNDLSNLPAPETHYQHRAYQAYPQVFYEGKPFNIAGTNKTYSDFDQGEGFVSNTIALDTQQVFNIPTPAFYASSSNNIVLTTRIYGRSDQNNLLNDHRVQINTNGTTLIDTLFGGYSTININQTLNANQLGATTTALEFKSMPIDDAVVNSNSVAWISIEYPHSFDFGGAKMFSFELDNNGDKYLEISNFQGGNAPVLYDISNQLRIQPILEGGVYKVKLNQVSGGAAKRQLIIYNSDAAAFCTEGCQFPNCIPEQCRLWTLSHLSAPIQYTNYAQASNEGNYLIVTHPSLRTGAVDEVERYRNYRNSPAGGSRQAIIVNIEELYDQFAWGIAKHPLAIRHFVNYALANWTVKPDFLFLLGKGVAYSYINKKQKIQYAACLVPSYGVEPSDILLSTPNNAVYQNNLSTGRIPAHTPNDVRIYLDKIITYENNFSSSNCDIDNRQWMKHALHLAGGSNLTESESFIEKLAEYKQVFEDSLLGGKVVYTYNKISEDVIQQTDLDQFVNNGLAMIMFFGHSTGNTWNLDLGNPESYTNHGKYPFIMTGSCFVGDIFGITTQEVGMAEDYVLADNLGAIGFLATASFGFPTWLHRYAKNLHQQFSRNNYGQPLGACIRQTIQEMSDQYFNQEGAKLTCQEYTFVGDPVLRLAAWDTPDLALGNTEITHSITFEPANITTDLSQFTVKVAVANLGKITADSATLHIERYLPNGTLLQSINRRITIPQYADTIAINLPIGDANDATGNNLITANIDYDNQIAEICENNNTASRPLFIFSDVLVPIVPCNYAIVGNAPVMLYASTGIPLSAARNYRLEIDTNALFNSPIKQQTLISSIGGVLKWQPTINYTDNTVYYWRTAPESDNPQWKISSFLYKNAAPEGYNQSHHQQWANNDLQQINISSQTPHFSFAPNQYSLIINNNYSSKTAIQILTNETTIGTGSQMPNECDGGIAFVVWQNNDGIAQNLVSQNTNGQSGCNGLGTYNNQQGLAGSTRQIEFRTNDPQQIDALLQFIQNTIQNGDYVAAYSVREHRLQDLDANVQNALQTFFNSMGISQINAVPNNQAFIAFGQKGSNGSIAPVWATSTTPALTFALNASFALATQLGSMKTQPIGPALTWNLLEWQTHHNDPSTSDQWALNIYGVNNNNEEILLLGNQNAASIDLSTIAATQYPFLRLELTAADTVYATPPQLDFWRIWFDRRAELALDAHYYYAFHADTLSTGDPMSLDIGVINPENSALNNIAVQYNIIAPDGSIIPQTQPLVLNLAAAQSDTIHITAPTSSMSGNYTLSVELNPNGELPEKFAFNNLLYLPFTVIKDKINPYIDVTFDGQHIGNGDLVSAKPEILARIKDDNPYLALNDTANFYIALKYTDPDTQVPNLIETPIPFNSPILQFVPPSNTAAEQGNNVAIIRLNPEFTDAGLYEFIIRAKDRSGNYFAQKNYNIRFKVEPKPMISHLLNYPNPFTTQTRFALLITGTEVPQDLNIQIMTVSGRVVREINRSELGNLHIGQNITEFAWDGTDQFGNRLANGIYLYRVNARLNGTPLNHYSTNADTFFSEQGWGKMYLLR
jgi:hypothetical protein